MKRIPAWLYVAMVVFIAYGIAREVWYHYWYRNAKIGNIASRDVTVLV